MPNESATSKRRMVNPERKDYVFRLYSEVAALMVVPEEW